MIKDEIKIVSLFDGISCGRIALENAGIIVSEYEAFETDKYAVSISRYNYPEIKQHGDVLNADFTQFAGYDLVMGGSPCTFWSIAKTNREADKNGLGWQLFMRFIEAIRIIKPKYFLYENVASMPKSIKEYITEELECEPILINSALVSAQQRKRLYWTNIQGVEQPEDKGILLADIIDNGIVHQDKSNCERFQMNMIAEPIAVTDKSNTLCAQYYKENVKSLIKRNKSGLYVANDVGAALRTRENDDGKFKRLEIRKDSKANSLTTVQSDSVICFPVRVGQCGETKSQGNRIYSVRGKTVTLMSNGGGRGASTGLYKIDLPDGNYIVRKLTPAESKRCQTLPDEYTATGVDDKGNVVKISNTQRYKCIGNGWTVDIITHILRYIK